MAYRDSEKRRAYQRKYYYAKRRNKPWKEMMEDEMKKLKKENTQLKRKINDLRKKIIFCTCVE